MNKSKKTIKGTKEPTKKKNIIDTKVWVIIGVVLGIAGPVVRQRNKAKKIASVKR